MGRGSGGGVRSVIVGVQFQRHPSRRSKGGVNPNQSAENKQKRILISTTYFILCPLCKVILWLSTGLTGVLCITLPLSTQLWTTRTTWRCFLWICPRPPQCVAMRPVASQTGSLARLASCFGRMRQDSSALPPIASSGRADAPC